MMRLIDAYRAFPGRCDTPQPNTTVNPSALNKPLTYLPAGVMMQPANLCPSRTPECFFLSTRPDSRIPHLMVKFLSTFGGPVHCQEPSPGQQVPLKAENDTIDVSHLPAAHRLNPHASGSGHSGFYYVCIRNHWLTFSNQGDTSLVESGWPLTSDIFSSL